MKTRHRVTLFLLFVLSGFCGLLYQVIWLRLAFASFGIVTPVLSVVLSVFMVGLAIGSWAGGRAARYVASTPASPMWLYALIELGIGLGAFLLPVLFGAGESFLLSFGDMDSGRYLAASGLLIAAAILPWCILMGATFPAAMAYFKRLAPANQTSFSYLYLANVIGAMAGALLTAVVLIETFGFTTSLWVAAGCNGLIALVSVVLALTDRSKPLPVRSRKAPVPKAAATAAAGASGLLAVLFLTGFASMAMEVVWTRAFTPALRTNIYAFAMLLATYLLATWVGSFYYRRALSRNKVSEPDRLLVWAALTACLPLVVNDPRLVLRGVGALTSIFPFCAILGYLTPMLIDRYSQGDPRRGGFAYAVNIVGCVLGPLIAGYLLLPTVGVKVSLILLALPFFAWVLAPALRPKAMMAPAWSAVVLLVLGIGPARSYEEHAVSQHSVVRRDHTATVISAGEGPHKQLLINGVGITTLTPITKLMAHVPLAFLDQAPKSALVICMGMGTTFRSLLSWDIDAWVAELVPSVRDAFPYYFSDANQLLAQPNAHVVIDDGRRFLRRSRESFDLITLDPPPPVEAAGSSLLYSTEFYDDAKLRLKPGGILAQWFPGGDSKTLEALSQSLSKSFPYVRVFQSVELAGWHFFASREPIPSRTADELLARIPPKAQADLMEWYPGRQPREILEAFLSKERDWNSMSSDPKWYISDDRPINEYYLLRRIFARG